jgi:hypothetical protein
LRVIRKLTVSFLCICALSMPPLAIGQQSTPQSAQPAQDPSTAKMDSKAKELLGQTVQALGGDAFLNFKSRTSQGRAFAIADGATAGFAPFESVVVYPDKRRFQYGKGQPVILLNEGDRGWEYDRYGLIRQDQKQVSRWKQGLRYGLDGLLRDVVREPETLVLDGGVDFVDLLPVRVLEISDGRHVRIKVFIHRSSLLPLRITYRLQDPKTGEWDEFSESYGDYREIQGIQTPMHIARYQNNERVTEYFLKSAQYNEEYPPEFFQPRR